MLLYLSPFGKGGRRGILRIMELPMIYKISPHPSFPKRGGKRYTRLREDPR
jgi:hypothetical protein